MPRAMRRALLVLAAAAAVVAIPSSALAYINGPGTPVRGGASGGTYNQLPVTGTCTTNGASVPITEFRLNLVNVSNYAEATPTGLVYRYSLTAVCDATDYVLGRFTVAPLAYSIDDAAGTLTFTGLSVPASFPGETIDGSTGTATLTAGSGPLGPIVFGADNATEKSQVVSLHKSITRAKTNAARAQYLNQLQSVLE